jgi:hypothetical protein
MTDFRIPSPEETEIDEEVHDKRDQLAELTFQRRWAMAGIVACCVIEVTLVVIAAVVSDSSGWTGGAFFFGIFGLVVAGSCLGFVLDSRTTRMTLTRELDRLEARRREVRSERSVKTSDHARYKEHLPLLAEQYKVRSKGYRRVFISLQLIIIIGSLSASSITAWSDTRDTKSVAIGISLAVGIAASCSLTFRPRERGDALQHTAIEIEREYRAAELHVGDYANEGDEQARLRKLVERVEALRAEQAATERSLDQPPDLHQSMSSGLKGS